MLHDGGSLPSRSRGKISLAVSVIPPRNLQIQPIETRAVFDRGYKNTLLHDWFYVGIQARHVPEGKCLRCAPANSPKNPRSGSSKTGRNSRFHGPLAVKPGHTSMAPRRKGIGNLPLPSPAYGCFCLGFDTQDSAYPSASIICEISQNGNDRPSWQWEIAGCRDAQWSADGLPLNSDAVAFTGLAHTQLLGLHLP